MPPKHEAETTGYYTNEASEGSSNARLPNPRKRFKFTVGKTSGRINNQLGLRSSHCSDDMLCILLEKEQTGSLADLVNANGIQLVASFVIGYLHIIKLTFQEEKGMRRKKKNFTESLIISLTHSFRNTHNEHLKKVIFMLFSTTSDSVEDFGSPGSSFLSLYSGCHDFTLSHLSSTSLLADTTFPSWSLNLGYCGLRFTPGPLLYSLCVSPRSLINIGTSV